MSESVPRLLVEVKAHWATPLCHDHKITKRLKRSKVLADQNGWGFEVWTEKDKLNAFL